MISVVTKDLTDTAPYLARLHDAHQATLVDTIPKEDWTGGGFLFIAGIVLWSMEKLNGKAMGNKNRIGHCEFRHGYLLRGL